MYTSTAVYWKCHASQRPPDIILRRSFTRPSTALAVIEGLGTVAFLLYMYSSSHCTRLWPHPFPLTILHCNGVIESCLDSRSTPYSLVYADDHCPYTWKVPCADDHCSCTGKVGYHATKKRVGLGTRLLTDTHRVPGPTHLQHGKGWGPGNEASRHSHQRENSHFWSS